MRAADKLWRKPSNASSQCEPQAAEQTAESSRWCPHAMTVVQWQLWHRHDADVHAASLDRRLGRPSLPKTRRRFPRLPWEHTVPQACSAVCALCELDRLAPPAPLPPTYVSLSWQVAIRRSSRRSTRPTTCCGTRKSGRCMTRCGDGRFYAENADARSASSALRGPRTSSCTACVYFSRISRDASETAQSGTRFGHAGCVRALA